MHQRTTSFPLFDPRHYGCSGWKYQGLSVCTNTVKASRAIVESVLLSAIQRDLFTEAGFMVFKQEVVRLFAERRRTPPRTGKGYTGSSRRLRARLPT